MQDTERNNSADIGVSAEGGGGCTPALEHSSPATPGAGRGKAQIGEVHKGLPAVKGTPHWSRVKE